MPSTPKNPNGPQQGLTPKQLAAQARAESEAAERRRERTIRIVGSLVVVLVVAGLLAVGILAGQSNDKATAGPTADPNAALPAGVESDTYGVKYGSAWGEGNDGIPTLELWEDFQCPACAMVEQAVGDQIKAIADAGDVKLMFRPAIFLDRNPASDNSSARATSAWGCAIDAGRTGEYHSAVFAAQPAEEGTGWTDEQLVGLGASVGIEGEAFTTFSQCVADGTYLAWGANSQQKFDEAEVGGTPTGYLNGQELKSNELADIEGLTQKIAAATTQ